MDANIFSQLLLQEFNQEMKTTKKVLERVPFDKFDWVPHPKSTRLGILAVHVATLPGMGAQILTTDKLSFTAEHKQPQVQSTAEIVALFEKSSGATRKALEDATDAQLLQPWKLIFGEKELLQAPRVLAFQTVMMNHHVHHRAQLGVFLRLNNIPIPGSYGPSADERNI